MNADRPDPRANGTRPRPVGRPPGHPAGRPRPSVGRAGVTLDRVTLQLGVAVAVVIALCSYAVSATSLYALGVQAGYSWWQAAAVPVVADGPAIYGMFRIVSRSRRGANGAGYGWLLVMLRDGGLDRRQRRPRPARPGRPGDRRRHPPGRAGHAGRPQGRRRRGHPPDRPGRRPGPRGRARPAWPAPAGHHRPTHRHHRQPGHARRRPAAPGGQRCPPGPARPTAARSGRGCRRPMPNRGRTASPGRPAPWPRPPAVAAAAPPASCNASAHRLEERHPVSRPSWQLRDAALGYASRGIPVLPLHYPLPHHSDLQPVTSDDHSRARRWGRAARVGIRAAASPASTPWAAWCPTGSRTPPPTGPGCWPGGPATPRPTSAWPPATASTSWTSTAPPAPRPSGPGRRRHGLQSSGPLVRTGGGGWHYYLAPTGLGNVRPAGLEHVDWRGRGGYVVAPPSRHASGHPYQWVAGRDLDTPLAEVPAALAGAAAAPTAAAARWSGRAPGRRRRPR